MATGTSARVPPAAPPSRSSTRTLAWVEYCARFFPRQRERHDFKALVAYGGYRRERGDTALSVDSQATSRHSVVEEAHVVKADGRSTALSADLSSWESEGGTTDR